MPTATEMRPESAHPDPEARAFLSSPHPVGWVPVGMTAVLLPLGTAGFLLALLCRGALAAPLLDRPDGRPAGGGAVATAPAALFFANHGQFPAPVRFAAVGPRGVVAALPDGLLVGGLDGSRGFGVRLSLGAPGQPEGEAPRPGAAHFLRGSDPARWARDVPGFGAVRYRQAWPGVDVLVRVDSDGVKYELLVQPGADVGRVELGYRGVDELTPREDGRLSIRTPGGVWVDGPPLAYQDGPWGRTPVPVRYAPREAGRFTFEVGSYDPRRTLVIDPTLAYATVLGGPDEEVALAMAVDAAGSVYVAGDTRSADFPTTEGAFDRSLEDGTPDIFVAKLTPDGAGLEFATFIGGYLSDTPYALAVDADGFVYVAGLTRSEDFPTTPGALDSSLDGPQDAFVTKLDPAGRALVFSTFLGGSGADDASALNVDRAGFVYVAGATRSEEFPTTEAAFDSSYNGGEADVFVARVRPDGSGLQFATLLGGTLTDVVSAIALDGTGAVYVTGATASEDFPTTEGAFGGVYNGGPTDAFVAKLRPDGAGLAFSTLLGGSASDVAVALAVDPGGFAYVAGGTDSPAFPITEDAFDTSFNGGVVDAFLAKLRPDGSGLEFATFFGGGGVDLAHAVALDGAGCPYVAGTTASGDLPTTADAFDASFNGERDAFVAKLDSAGSALVHSTFLGGAGTDVAFAVAVDRAGSVYLAGGTDSADFPTTSGAFDTSPHETVERGVPDVFVAKLAITPGPVPPERRPAPAQIPR